METSPKPGKSKEELAVERKVKELVELINKSGLDIDKVLEVLAESMPELKYRIAHKVSNPTEGKDITEI